MEAKDDSCDKGQFGQQIEAAHIVPYRLHGPRLIAESTTVGAIAGQQRVSRGKSNKASLSQLAGIRAVGAAAQTDDHLVADAIVRGMRTKHGRSRRLLAQREEPAE